MRIIKANRKKDMIIMENNCVIEVMTNVDKFTPLGKRWMKKAQLRLMVKYLRLQ